uniref:Uncharacterized protein n=1 Tax=Grammatophora oceanica TaxID=210454 RepID=A0A7S1VQN3_9STRA|mmetsp:Transcript_53415/g.79786  ORF Transcript_53415/g.79786 Transcript_53415/m.79786 type:complete len:571 (+) Transcript_53415:261-1973(+)|eukprot:CAMPEP_0194047154 /NCGR_PEP_ID=MMETSP0009_2-20130614/23588_1 /TAXON_ID=210454 /ORGANISM="Grammatophora oceanica, Strain CCMP 410" /LENGTH=570 /DNA_ID=CAMNT_0038692681 /DNA_START=238 /DNA_END=1950 /DNA_ORIENTATION=-
MAKGDDDPNTKAQEGASVGSKEGGNDKAAVKLEPSGGLEAKQGNQNGASEGSAAEAGVKRPRDETGSDESRKDSGGLSAPPASKPRLESKPTGQSQQSQQPQHQMIQPQQQQQQLPRAPANAPVVPQVPMNQAALRDMHMSQLQFAGMAGAGPMGASPMGTGPMGAGPMGAGPGASPDPSMAYHQQMLGMGAGVPFQPHAAAHFGAHPSAFAAQQAMNMAHMQNQQRAAMGLPPQQQQPQQGDPTHQQQQQQQMPQQSPTDGQQQAFPHPPAFGMDARGAPFMTPMGPMTPIGPMGAFGGFPLQQMMMTGRGPGGGHPMSRSDMMMAQSGGVPFRPHFLATAGGRLPNMPGVAGVVDFRNMTPQTPAISLSLACDDEHLSEYQILVRKQLEVFEAQPEDVESNTQGRKKQVTLGQVGIRCRHCASLTLRQRGRGAVYYPAKLQGVYQAAQNMASSHLCESCQCIDESIKLDLKQLRERRDTASGGKQYWADGARALGLYEAEDCLRLRREQTNNSNDDETNTNSGNNTSGNGVNGDAATPTEQNTEQEAQQQEAQPQQGEEANSPAAPPS